jgi:hypothetical protein
MPQDIVGPAVQNRRHRHGLVRGVEREPFGRLGDVPYDEDGQTDEVPGVGEGDRARTTEEEIGSEADEQYV